MGLVFWLITKYDIRFLFIRSNEYSNELKLHSSTSQNSKPFADFDKIIVSIVRLFFVKLLSVYEATF